MGHKRRYWLCFIKSQQTPKNLFIKTLHTFTLESMIEPTFLQNTIVMNE